MTDVEKFRYQMNDVAFEQQQYNSRDSLIQFGEFPLEKHYEFVAILDATTENDRVVGGFSKMGGQR